MKNKRNTILGMAGFIAIIAMIGFSVTACDELMDLLHEHDYSTGWSYNETQHWHECECGDKIDVGNHTGNSTGTACTVCGKTHEHSYGDTYKTNATQHWKECSCGNKKDTASHYYLLWGKDANYHWKECECGVGNNDKKLHSFSTTYKFSATEHWKECECYQRSSVGSHTSTTSCTTCTFDTTANPLFVGSWIRYTYWTAGVTYARYTFNDDGTGLIERTYLSSDDIETNAVIWSAKGGQLTIAYVDYDLSQTYTYLIENFTLSYWTDPSNKYILIRQAGDGSMDEDLVDTWIYDAGAAGSDELRFFSDGTASLTQNIFNATKIVTDYIWTARNGQYELYGITGTGNYLPALKDTRTYTISSNTLNTSNPGGGSAKAYTRKYGNGYAIGDRGPGGGIVFYDTGKENKDGWRYIEAAVEDLGTDISWASDYISISSANEIGTGKANTLAIIAAYPDDTALNNAAKFAVSYRGGDLEDWFLPSQSELFQFYDLFISELTDGYWWSSTQYDEDRGVVVSKSYGGSVAVYGIGKIDTTGNRVRPVRYF